MTEVEVSETEPLVSSDVAVADANEALVVIDAHDGENHGFYRHYHVAVDGDRWEISDEHERATITFSDDNWAQTVVWEWKPDDTWLPLCDRTAARTD